MKNKKVETIVVITLLLTGLFIIIFGFLKLVVPTIISLVIFLICAFTIIIVSKFNKKYSENTEIFSQQSKTIQLSVKDMLSDEIYNKLETIYIGWFSEIVFFEKNNIDAAQIGFRNEHWAGNEYVIIGYDPTAGLGPDPYIIKIDEKELPVYWLMTDGGDWKNPDKIANSLDDFIKILNLISDNLTSNTNPSKEYILNEIAKINANNYMWYWENLLDTAIQSI